MSINATPRTVDAGNRLDRELRDVAEYVDHPSGAGDDPGEFVEPGMQVGLV